MSLRFYFLLAFLKLVVGWGFIGHNTTAYLAYNLLNNGTKNYLLDVYNITNRDSFVGLATWADSIKSLPKYSWSYELHFVDVMADPPKNCYKNSSYLWIETRDPCIINYNLDCVDDRCVIGAIKNYTKRYLEIENDFDSLRFLIHFWGDIFQPFHVSYRKDLGGNLIKVKYNGGNTNLHSVWDSELIDTFVYELGGINEYYNYMEIYSKDIVPKISNDPMIIAQLGLSTICNNYLYCDLGNHIESGSIISKDYYERNIEIIKNRLSMSAFFMASILNERSNSHFI